VKKTIKYSLGNDFSLQISKYNKAKPDEGLTNMNSQPFISILIATYNEKIVIEDLMRSCAALTYSKDKFEIIIVDDSTDNTFDILKDWTKKLPNLKVIPRTGRKGWKGGALNVALKNISNKSSYVLVVDADNILLNNTLEAFVSRFEYSHSNGNSIDVVQGYPISMNASNDRESFSTGKRITNNEINVTSIIRSNNRNWISRAIDFRLAQRNMIEFLGKDHMSIPLQVTGSLFMIRGKTVKSLAFSEDLCEDWELTIDLYLSSKVKTEEGVTKKRKAIDFDPSLISFSEIPNKFRSYYTQRMRVSEGHTRGFRKNIIKILTSKMPFTHKIDFFFTGLQYAKFIPIIPLLIMDLIFLVYSGSTLLNTCSLLVQAASILIAIGTSLIAIFICRRSRRDYEIKDGLALIFLNLCTIPALAFGSMRGLFKNQGIFHNTERNN
jgi:cellulose synthase/poly-beta-1,6-N-acetylglucosamine synthase-like glycosyltransferase